MPFEYVFVYLLIDVFCAAFSLVIYSKITIDMGAERVVRALRGFIIAFLVFLLADAVWALGYYDVLPLTDAAVGIIESATMLVMGVVSYCWFMYAEYRMNESYVSHKAFARIAAIPLIIVAVLYATTRFTGWIYRIGADATYSDGPLRSLPMFVFMLYVAYVAVHAIIRYRQDTSSAEKRAHLTLIAFIICPTICGLIDVMIHGMPVMALSVFSSVLLVFMNSQTARINTDALTGLNNRRRAVEYIEDALHGAPANAVFGVLMIDVDFFKEINDTRGHNEGDRVLRAIAQGLRNAMDGRHGLAARWGGDEFLVAMFFGTEEQPLEVEDIMQREISAACLNANDAYNVSVSIGYALARQGIGLTDLVAQADQQLYAQKAAHHAEIADTASRA